MLKKLYRAFQNFIKYLRKGGVVYVNVSQVTYTECLKGRKALITGGGSGVGYAIAQKFLSSGAEVTITGRNPDKLAQVAAHLNSTRLHTLVWDVANISSTEKKINEAIQIMGGLDILVNNAGQYTFLPFEKIDEAEWDKIIHTNLKGTFFICQQAVKYFKKEKEKTRVKKIINISSTRGFQGDCGPYGYFQMGSKRTHKRIGQRLHPRRHPRKRHCAGNYRTPPERYRSPRKRIRRLQQRAPYSHCRRNRRTGSFSGKRLIQSHYRSNHSL